MKRKGNLKKESLKTIDPAVLEEILGGAQAAGGDEKNVAVIRQEAFSSFFHS